VSEYRNVGIIDETKKLELIVGGENKVMRSSVMYTVHKIDLR
jgi:hypothetical protein